MTHRVDGNGPPLALLNGGLMSIAAWDPVIPALAGRFRVVRFDFRGQLLSPGPANGGLANHAADLVALLDHLEIPSAHLVGTSFGAEVAILVASRYPGRVDSLVCITATDRLTDQMAADSAQLRDAARSAAEGGDPTEVFRILAPFTFSESFRKTHADMLDFRARQIAKLPREYFAGLSTLMLHLLELDLERDLPRIRAATLVLGAELDRVFPLAHSEALARSIPGARLEILEGVGHGAIVEATDAIVDAVIGFLDPPTLGELPVADHELGGPR